MMRMMAGMLLLMMSVAKGQSVFTNFMAGSTGLGQKLGNLWGQAAYPATMTGRNSSIGMFAEDRFMTDLGYYELGITSSVGSQPFQIGFSREGNLSFSDVRASTSFSRKISKELAFAVRLGYGTTMVKGYPGKGEPIAGLGAKFQLSEKIRWAMQADGLNGFFGGSPAATLSLRTGIGYTVSNLAVLTLELIKEQEYPVQVVAGISYAFTAQLSASLGYASQWGSLLFGITMAGKKADIQVSTSYHGSLGPSGGLSLIYHFKSPE